MVVIVCDDGCSTASALVVDVKGVQGQNVAALEGEDGFELGADFTKDALWAELPEDYSLQFMEAHD